MKTTNKYSFDKNVSGSFLVLFGSTEYIKEFTTVKELTMHEVWPNPVDGEVNFSFTLPDSSQKQPVNLQLMDIMGREVWRYENSFTSGYHEVNWKRGEESSGIYLVTLKTGGSYKQVRLVLK